MKRSLHRGIFFYPMEVGYISNKRIRLLLNDHGPTGYWVWSCIIHEAYRVEGYFHKADADDIDFIAVDSRQTPELVYRIIESCIKRGLFDERVFKKENVLTNDRMQINYIKATYDRRRKGTPTYFYQKHFLLTEKQLADIGERNLQNVLFFESNIPVFCNLTPSPAKQQSSPEPALFSTENKPPDGNVGEIPGKNENENENEIIRTTNVVPVDTAPENEIIGLKPINNNGISDLAKKNAPGQKKKVARKKKARDPDSEPHWHILRRSWVDFNLKHLHFKVEPIPKADYSFMHRIIEKLRERATDQGVPWTEQEAVVRWEKFLSTAYNCCDKWLHDHFEMKNLATQMQTIFNLVENGSQQINNKTGKQNHVDQRIIIDTNATSSGKY